MVELLADRGFEEAGGNMLQAHMAAAQLARVTRRDLEKARQLQAQLDAQRVAARAELAPVHESSSWDQAQVRDVARAYETAVAFRDEYQAARDAESRIREELRERYDGEVLETGADPAVVRATLVDRDTERVERQAAQARDGQVFATGLAGRTETHERSAPQSSKSLSTGTWLEIFSAAAHHEGTVTEICHRYGVSRQSFYIHLRRLRAEGIDGLAERSRRPIRSPGRIPAELELRVVQLRRDKPWLGARAIRSILLAEGCDDAPAISTIGNIIRRNGLPLRAFNPPSDGED